MFKNFISLFMSLMIFISSGITGIIPKKESLRVVVPENWEMTVGDSRTLECVFTNSVTNRVVEWSVSDNTKAVVDIFGRVTATGVGKVTINAKAGNLTDSVELNVVRTPTMMQNKKIKIDYGKEALSQVDNFQKIVTRFSKGSEEIPDLVKNTTDYSSHQSLTTKDGAKWEITNYGVLRTDENAPTERDREQRFMGDRYFYSSDTTDGKVLAIFDDGENGIWAVMDAGVTHIAMVKMSGDDKAAQMSNDSQENVARHGLVSEAYKSGNNWAPYATDNDGLWTSMYGAGELMRYATLRDDPNATEEEIAAARETAISASEAILMLHYISMRTGTTQAYVRYQYNGKMPGDAVDRWLSAEALIEGGNYSYLSPEESPAKAFEKNYASLLYTGSTDKIMNAGGICTVVDPSSWASTRDEANKDVTYAKQTRLLEGFVARTYWIESEESFPLYDNIYWQVNEDNTATGISTKSPSSQGYYLNNENLRGVTVDASGEIPERLWNNLVGEEVLKSDVIYKGDTSADELVGHAFILKLMYDILGDEDPELKALIVTAIDNLAQHLVDNGYMLVDGSGQPTTWSNFSRTSFSVSSSVPMAPLHAMVILSVFKTASYITGYEKWENEYRLAALDPAYEYAKVVAQQSERMNAAIANVVGDAVSPLLSLPLRLLSTTELYGLINKVVSNDSDLEMAMLGLYTLFQTETDEEILSLYRKSLEAWWEVASSTENPLWYYVYQLAYPDKTIKDAYGNHILETASWSLSRHPISTVRYKASNTNRDDIAQLDLSALGLDMHDLPTYSLKSKHQPAEMGENPEIMDYVKLILSASSIEWTVAAPDERALHKYNENSYILDGYYQPTCMEASTTYTLPYWMARYHGMLSK